MEVFADGKWNTVAKVEGNFMRKRIHRFAQCAAEKVRINVFATHGDPSARVIEVRAALD